MPNYAFKCGKCGAEADHMFKMGERPEQVPCVECGGMSKFLLIPPGIMTHSYLDGTKRFSGAKEAAKLNTLAARAEGSEKQDIEKEIKKTGYNFKKDPQV